MKYIFILVLWFDDGTGTFKYRQTAGEYFTAQECKLQQAAALDYYSGVRAECIKIGIQREVK